MTHLETLTAEYLDWQGYLVMRNKKVGRLKHGGWEMELDTVGYHPKSEDLVHYEPSIDAKTWKAREGRYKRRREQDGGSISCRSNRTTQGRSAEIRHNRHRQPRPCPRLIDELRGAIESISTSFEAGSLVNSPVSEQAARSRPR